MPPKTWILLKKIFFFQRIFKFTLFTFNLKAEGKRFNWNEYEVNLILGSFFWGYICTELPGGRLSEIIGTRQVFGYSMLISSFITLFTPLAANLGYTAVAALRVFLGFMLVIPLRHYI